MNEPFVGDQSKRTGCYLGLTLALLLLLGGAGWLWHVSTNGIHLSATEFITKAGPRDVIGSMQSDRYIGHQDGKVRFEIWRSLRIPKQIIYWTELDGLPPAVAEEVRAGTGRWQLAQP